MILRRKVGDAYSRQKWGNGVLPYLGGTLRRSEPIRPRRRQHARPSCSIARDSRDPEALYAQHRASIQTRTKVASKLVFSGENQLWCEAEGNLVQARKTHRRTRTAVSCHRTEQALGNRRHRRDEALHISPSPPAECEREKRNRNAEKSYLRAAPVRMDRCVYRAPPLNGLQNISKRAMILSMTGYGEGKATHELGCVSVTLRTVNSKGFELYSVPLPTRYRKLEMEIRSRLQSALKRGRVECTFSMEWNGGAEPSDLILNQALLLSLLSQAQEALEQGQRNGLRVGAEDIALCAPTLISRTELWDSDESLASETESAAVIRAFDMAIDNLTDYRLAEGKATERDFLEQLKAIEDLRLEIDAMKDDRVENIKSRIQRDLEAFQNAPESRVDPQRLAQELIFYIEKLDINEELKRLEQHCLYFRETLAQEESAGKKLNFIAQEMGREINTLGSKANDHTIQRCVVQMKDHLERIKEQTLNIL